MKSLPAHSAACRKASAIAQVRTITKTVRETVIQVQVFEHPHYFTSLCQEGYHIHRLSDHLVTSVVSNTGSTAYLSVTEKQASVLLDLR